jgi:hypothetical protein
MTTSVWGVSLDKKVASLKDIMIDQQEYDYVDSQVEFKRLEEDEDYQLALKLQNEEVEKVVSTTSLEDQQLAECMQLIEDEERNTNFSQPGHGTDKFSKVTVQSSHGSNTHSNRSNVNSSEFLDAIELENSLQNSSRNVQCIFKHDPLLQSLSNSATLSELDGVGDLLGSRLLVGNTVANSLKTFVHKNEDRQIQMKMNKLKKVSVQNVTLPLSKGNVVSDTTSSATVDIPSDLGDANDE